VQMPPGIPVATVAINGAANAGLLAAKILATSDVDLAKRVWQYSLDLENTIIQKAKRLEEIGFAEYLGND